MTASPLLIQTLLLLASAIFLARAAVHIFGERKIGSALFPLAVGIGILWEGVQPDLSGFTLMNAVIFLVAALLLAGLPLLGYYQASQKKAEDTEATDVTQP
jgi:hypothetical protein